MSYTVIVLLIMAGALFSVAILLERYIKKTEATIRDNKDIIKQALKDQIAVLTVYRNILKAEKYREYTEDDEILDMRKMIIDGDATEGDFTE